MIWNWMVAKGTIQMRSESPHVKWYRIQFVRSYKKVSFQPSLLLSRNEIGIQIELETLFHTRDKILPSKYLILTFVLSKKIFLFFTPPHWWGKDWPQRTTKKAFPKKEEDTAPNEYSWTNLYLMSILSRLLLEAEKRLSLEEHQDCPEGHFPKLNFILKVKRERV